MEKHCHPKKRHEKTTLKTLFSPCVLATLIVPQIVGISFLVLGLSALQPFLGFFCKNTVFPPWKLVIFVRFSVSPFLSPSLLSMLFLFFFLSLSLSLFLSFSLLFLFLVFCPYLFYFPFFLPCLSVVLFCLVSLLLFHEKIKSSTLSVLFNACLLSFKSLSLCFGFVSLFQLCV